MACRRSARRQQRHSQMNDMLWRAIKREQIPAMKEPAGLLRRDDKRPDGATLIPLAKGKLKPWDVTIPDTSTESHLSSTASTAAEQGAAAKQAADNKTAKYQGLEKTHLFSQLPSRQRDHGVSTPLNWCEKSGDAPLSSQRTAEKPPSCFRGCQWLCRGEMRSHS